MNNVLIIDIGNTSTKFSLCDIKDEKVLEQLIEYNNNIDKNKDVKELLNSSKFIDIVIGSVNYNVQQKLQNYFKKIKIKDKNIIILNQDIFTPIFKKVKEKKENIGIDILSLSYYIAEKFNSGVGICSGTAIFVTVVDKKIIKGVSIAPSLRRSFSTIAENAFMIDSVSISSVNKSFGLDTNSAISSAYFHMVNGFIHSVITEAKKITNFKKVILTGGNDIFQKEIKREKGIQYLYDNKQVITLGYLLVYKNKIVKKK